MGDADEDVAALGRQVAQLSSLMEAKNTETTILQNAVANLSNRLTQCEAELKELKTSSSKGGPASGPAARPPLTGRRTPSTSGPPASASSQVTTKPATSKPASASSRVSMGTGRRPPAGRDEAPKKAVTAKDKSIKEKSASVTRDDSSMRMYLRGRPVTLYAPTGYDMSSLDHPAKPPSENLELQWVYGYRGRDGRNNLFTLPSGELLYFIAAVGVIYNPETRTQRHYRGHNDDIKAMALHPNFSYVATGQVAGHDKQEGKPHVRVWNVENLDTLAVIGLGSFDRGFSAVGFSQKNGGAYLLAIDDSNDHILSVWDWEKNKKLAETKSHGDAVLGAAFNPGDDNAIVTYGKQHLLFWTLDGNKLSKKSGLFEKQPKPKFVTCMVFNQDNEVITGDSNGHIFQWGNHKVVKSVKDAHEGGIFSATVLADGTILTGGGKDHRIAKWTSELEEAGEATVLPDGTGAVRTIVHKLGGDLYLGTTHNTILAGSAEDGFNTVIAGHSDELWGLAVHPTQGTFVSAGYDKTVTYWNSDTHHPVWTTQLNEAAQSADIHPDSSVVAVGLRGGNWLILDASNGETIFTSTAGDEQHDAVKFSPDGSKLAVGSHDNYIYIYNVKDGGKSYEKVGRCSGHSSFITHLDWSKDSQNLKSCSGDYELLFWDAMFCKQATSAAALRDASWATYTTVLGFDVAGIWPEGADGTDINTVGRNNAGSLVATGDDFGKVNLFRFPVPQAKSESTVAHGHSSHVTCVRFIHDDSCLLSTGGKDTSIMQWRIA